MTTPATQAGERDTAAALTPRFGTRSRALAVSRPALIHCDGADMVANRRKCLPFPQLQPWHQRLPSFQYRATRLTASQLICLAAALPTIRRAYRVFLGRADAIRPTSGKLTVADPARSQRTACDASSSAMAFRTATRSDTRCRCATTRGTRAESTPSSSSHCASVNR